MEQQLQKFIEFISHAKDDLNFHRQLASTVGCSKFTLDIFDKIIDISDTLEKKATQGDLKVNYLNQFQSNLNTILNSLQYRGQRNLATVTSLGNRDAAWKKQTKLQLENTTQSFSNLYDQIAFNLTFFEKIGFFNNNVVAIGANGSGKTTLSNKFKSYLQNNGVVISAQRILLVPDFDSIANPSTTANQLKQTQVRDKTNKNAREFSHLQQEFGIVLKNLLAENITAGNTYRKKSIELVEEGKPLEEPRLTNLDKTLSIWNSLIDHRNIDCADGMNIIAKSDDGRSYSAVQMSDGEKVMLYLIGQVLQAPQDGFIVIDEPEMYLHKTILKKLWDILENERSDCLFIYLTHDLDFATSRTTAKKIWIKSFDHPDKWEIEDIPNEEIPEPLMLELLGSRKNILFCEGRKGSIDDKVYSILFPNLTVMPVGSCFDVTNHTKAFNKLTNVNTKALGLIDSDHHDSLRLDSLKEEDICSFRVAEIENLFLDTDFLKILAKQLLVDEKAIESIQNEVLKTLNSSKELQASNFVSAKINYFFSDSDVSKGNKLTDVKQNYEDFLNNVSIETWYEDRTKEIEEIVQTSNYKDAISIFNNKGLKGIANRHLKISDFTDRSIKLLQSTKHAQSVILNYFPDKIKSYGATNN